MHLNCLNVLLADAATAPATTSAPVPQGNLMMQLAPMVLLVVVFYFILIRPQQKRVRMQQDLMKSLQKGNKILTSGGLIGTIVKFEGDDVAVIEVAQNVRVRVSRSAISEVVSDKAAAGEGANDN